MDLSKQFSRITKFWARLEETDKILIFLLLFSFCLRVCFLFYSPLRGWDESVYLNLGQQLSKNFLSYSLITSGWSDYIPSSEILYSWPNIGFRAPLLPFLFSIFYFLKLNFFIEMIVPFFATASIFLVYILGKELFNKKIALYSAVLFSLLPIHVYLSSKTLTDVFVVFFLLLTFVSFWRGYERGKIRHKIFFGIFLALSLLARYTTLWVTPVFLIYFLIRDRSLEFIKDKYLWYSIGAFFATMVPWFIYGFIYYNNPIGGFIHGFKGAGYWGGVQPWTFFFENSWQIFSIIGILFIISLLYIFYKKEYLKKEIYLLLIWLSFFSLIVMAMPHKENRFIMPIVPTVCLIFGFFIEQFKKIKKYIFGLICLFLLFSLWILIKTDYLNSKSPENVCFKEANKFLSGNISTSKDPLLITNQSPIVYYYTKKENKLYPEPWSLDIFKNIFELSYYDKEVYFLFSNYDMLMDGKIKKDLDNNFKKVFECSKKWGYSAVYKYN